MIYIFVPPPPAKIHRPYITRRTEWFEKRPENAPEQITGPLEMSAYDLEGRIQRAGYHKDSLERLQDLAKSPRYLAGEQRSPAIRAQKFLQGKEWQAQRIAVCRALDNSTDGGNAVKQLATELDETSAVASRFELNAAVSICHQGKYPSRPSAV